MRITHRQAFEEPDLRQAYLDEIVEIGGGKPDFVHSYQYVTDAEMRKVLAENGEIIPETVKVPSGATISLENKMGKPSIVYFPEVNFSDILGVLYQNGYPSSDFEIVNSTEVMDHETKHARHYMNGIPNMSIDRFDFDNELEKALFLCVSEVAAHGSHIKALGLSSPILDYPKKYQRFLIGEVKRYVSTAAQIFRSGKVDSTLQQELQRNIPELKFRAL